MRIYVLFLLVAFLSVYAYRDWFKSLCGLILLMAVIEHPDMPKNIMNVQGFNPWNLLMLNVAIAWFIDRTRKGVVWDMPRHINVLLLLYLGVILVAFARAFIDQSHLDNMSAGTLVSEHLINAIKWVFPGMLLFDGCRTQERYTKALACILLLYVFLAIQVTKWMLPYTAFGGAELEATSRKLILNEIGYHRVNMSMMLAGASWAILATVVLMKRRWQKVAIVMTFVMIAYAQAMTGGRMGYVTWGVVGLVMCMIRWRKYLVGVVLVPLIIAAALPGARERLFYGFEETNPLGEQVTNTYEVTAGRTLIWPYVVDKIMESPILGYGELAMERTGLSEFLRLQLIEEFSHPHNAYFQLLLDSGLIGFLIIMTFWSIILWHAVRLCLDTRLPAFVAIGGVTCSLVLALLVAGMGSQTFYPREGAVGMWAAIGLMMRVWVQRRRLTAPKTEIRTTHKPQPPAMRVQRPQPIRPQV
jgi:O-antigen ligase